MIKQVALGSSAAVTILTPGAAMRNGYIQNNGSNDARLAFDGGTLTPANPAGGFPAGQDPTANLGYVLSHGKEIDLAALYGSQLNGFAQPLPPIRAIAVTGSTTLDIATTDMQSV